MRGERAADAAVRHQQRQWIATYEVDHPRTVRLAIGTGDEHPAFTLSMVCPSYGASTAPEQPSAGRLSCWQDTAPHWLRAPPRVILKRAFLATLSGEFPYGHFRTEEI